MASDAFTASKRTSAPPKLLTAYSRALSALHLPPASIRRRRACVRAYLRFHYDTHPSQLDEQHVRLFLLHLRHHKKFSLARCQACMSALLFLYRHVLGQPDFWVWDPTHPALLFTRNQLML
ncbi:MAG: site-specific integrase [Cyclonatronaceae bacterium]